MIAIFFDGLCYPKNPGGVATYGYLIYRNGELIQQGCGVVGEGRSMTNNVAEYEALKAAVQWIGDRGIGDRIVIRGDSQLVIKQMVGEWQVKSDTSKKYVPEIRRLLAGKVVTFEWISREENKEADRLSRIAYQEYRRKQQGRK